MIHFKAVQPVAVLAALLILAGCAQRGQAAADAAGYGSAAAAFGRQQFCAEGRAGGYGAGS